jgi:hypothetical protein
VSNPTFYCPSRDGRSKAATIHTTSGTILPSTPPRGTIGRPLRSGFSRVRPYPFLVNPLRYGPTGPRAPLVNKGTTPARRQQGIACPPQDPGSFAVPSPTSPRHPRDGRHSQRHVATTTSTEPTAPSPPRHHPRVFWTPRPPLESIKEEAESSPLRRSTSQAILHFFLFLETWDRLPLS